jgi:ABC-2 type transport system permease protein
MVLPMFFLSGAFFPLNGVPIWMTWLSRFDPVTYGVDPLRQVAVRESVSQQVLAALSIHPIAFDLMIMAVMGIIFLIPAVWLFSKQD